MSYLSVPVAFEQDIASINNQPNLDFHASTFDPYQTDAFIVPVPSNFIHANRGLVQIQRPTVIGLDQHYGVQPSGAQWHFVPLGNNAGLEAPYPDERNYPFIVPNQLRGLASGAQYANLRAPTAYDGY